MEPNLASEDPLDGTRALKAQNIRLTDQLFSLRAEASAQQKVFYDRIQEFSASLAATSQFCAQNYQDFEQQSAYLNALQYQLQNKHCELTQAQEEQRQSELEILELREQLYNSYQQTQEYLRLFMEAQSSLDDSYSQIEALRQSVAYSEEQIACLARERDEALAAVYECDLTKTRYEQYKMLIVSLKKKVQNLRKQLKNYATDETMEALYNVSHGEATMRSFGLERPKSSSWTPFELKRTLQAMSATGK